MRPPFEDAVRLGYGLTPEPAMPLSHGVSFCARRSINPMRYATDQDAKGTGTKRGHSISPGQGMGGNDPNRPWGTLAGLDEERSDGIGLISRSKLLPQPHARCSIQK